MDLRGAEGGSAKGATNTLNQFQFVKPKAGVTHGASLSTQPKKRGIPSAPLTELLLPSLAGVKFSQPILPADPVSLSLTLFSPFFHTRLSNL